MKVIIEAEISGKGIEGGIHQFLMGMLAHLRPGKQGLHYQVSVVPENQDWLKPVISPEIQIISRPRAVRNKLKVWLGPFAAPLLFLKRKIFPAKTLPSKAEYYDSDGFYESHGPDVIHATYPVNYRRYRVPTVVSVFDLQHRHYPEFFSPWVLQWREVVYQGMFDAAQAIAVPTQWVKNDLMKQHQIPAEKVFVIPLASRLDQCVASAGPLTSIPNSWKRFYLFPAVTYQHKNHIRLLEAIAWLRDKKGIKINLVCTGDRSLHWPTVENTWKSLGLESQVIFSGIVNDEELIKLYRTAHALLFPSLFEGGTLPILEALSIGLPVVCSDIGPNVEYAGDAGLYFDGLSVDSIAQTLEQFECQPALREELLKRGSVQSKKFSWHKTARMYEALYLYVGKQSLTSEQEQLLFEPQSSFHAKVG